MMFLPSQLEEAAGRFQARFLLACLSSGFEPTVVYAAAAQLQLVNLYRAMGSNHKDCLGACTTGAAAIELVARTRPGILLMVDDLPDYSLVDLFSQARKVHPCLRSFAFVTKLDQFDSGTGLPIIVADQDLLVHPQTITLMSMAVVTNTSYHSPSIQKRLKELGQRPSGYAEDIFQLSLREQQLLEAYALGLSNKETAEQLGLTVRTVQTYSTNLLHKLGVNNRQKALRRAISLGYKALLRAADYNS
jgi:DNA-binding NarL/FixJ family response regulator